MESLRLYTSSDKISPWCEYTPRSLATKIHDSKVMTKFGQRKLLISEIQFLTHFEGNFVIYVGSACGIHIKYLVALFPEKIFYLIDSSPHDRDLSALPNVIIQSTLFTNDLIDIILAEFIEHDIVVSKDVLFISDIRSQNAIPTKNHNGQQDLEDSVLTDMNLQMDWVLKLKPAHALLKFRLPYIVGMSEYVDTKNTIRYLDGIILKQIYSPEQSSECRLIASYDSKLDSYPMTTYDCRLYENQMYFYNRYSRIRRVYIPDEIFNNVKKFRHDKIILRRAELSFECDVWKEYLEIFRKIDATPTRIVRLINDLTKSMFESYLTN